MPSIKSKLISGVVGNEVLTQKFRREMGLRASQPIGYMVMETKVEGKTYYCCWSGGELDGEDMHLTEIGKAAFQALMALPIGDQGSMHIQELKLGKTSLKRKVIRMLKDRPAGSKICFVGDMAGELDGHLTDAFNLVGSKTITAQ